MGLTISTLLFCIFLLSIFAPALQRGFLTESFVVSITSGYIYIGRGSEKRVREEEGKGRIGERDSERERGRG